MRIAVIGPGAMGCLFAAGLSRAKQEVWLLDKDRERAGQLDREGIRVEGVSGSWRAKPRVTAQAEDIGCVGLALVCVKAYHTKEACQRLRPLLGEETQVLTLQNGIGNIEIIQESLGQERVVGGVTSEGATLLEAGRIRHAGKGETVIGRLDGKISVQMRYLREALNKAGFACRIAQDIKGQLWSKLVINAGINALSAVTRLANGRLLEQEGSRRILREACAEAARVAKRKRIKLSYDDPLAKAEAVCQATGANISSMLQDVLKGKRTEVDFINGVVARHGQELGIATPVNALLLDLIKTVEAGYEMQKD
jgi:2-dehydropantoate 2-reductase